MSLQISSRHETWLIAVGLPAHSFGAIALPGGWTLGFSNLAIGHIGPKDAHQGEYGTHPGKFLRLACTLRPPGSPVYGYLGLDVHGPWLPFPASWMAMRVREIRAKTRRVGTVMSRVIRKRRRLTNSVAVDTTPSPAIRRATPSAAGGVDTQ